MRRPLQFLQPTVVIVVIRPQTLDLPALLIDQDGLVDDDLDQPIRIIAQLRKRTSKLYGVNHDARKNTQNAANRLARNAPCDKPNGVQQHAKHIRGGQKKSSVMERFRVRDCVVSQHARKEFRPLRSRMHVSRVPRMTK